MKVLKEIKSTQGANWQLIQCESDFFEFGTENEIRSFWGCSVSDCGTKEEVTNRLKNLIKLSDSFISDYTKKNYHGLLNWELEYNSIIKTFLNIINEV